MLRGYILNTSLYIFIHILQLQELYKRALVTLVLKSHDVIVYMFTRHLALSPLEVYRRYMFIDVWICIFCITLKVSLSRSEWCLTLELELEIYNYMSRSLSKPYVCAWSCCVIDWLTFGAAAAVYILLGRAKTVSQPSSGEDGIDFWHSLELAERSWRIVLWQGKCLIIWMEVIIWMQD